jgi:hypothetical protein
MLNKLAGNICLFVEDCGIPGARSESGHGREIANITL